MMYQIGILRFDIMSDSEEEHILFLQLVVLFKMKKKKKREQEKYGYRNYFVNMKKEHSTI